MFYLTLYYDAQKHKIKICLEEWLILLICEHHACSDSIAMTMLSYHLDKKEKSFHTAQFLRSQSVAAHVI